MGLASTLGLWCLLAYGPHGDGTGVDQVKLRNGNRLEGRVVFEDLQTLVLRTGTRERELRMSDVAHVDSRARHVREGLQRWRAIYSKDVRKTLDLATFYCRVELEDEAVLLAWYVLTIDPKNEEAHAILGHERRDGRWFARVSDGWVPFDELDGRRSAWADAWEFSSEHYRLKTNLPLVEAIAIALDLEGFYGSFFELFGDPLRLYEVTEPMQVAVHASAGSFPEKLADRKAFFDLASNTVHLQAVGEFDRGLLFHEASHQLLDNTSRRVRTAAADIPAWLDEGLAEFLRAGMTGLPGRAVFRAGLPARSQFERCAGAPELGDVPALFALSSSDFETPTRADLAYARAYTFVHFCVHGDAGANRARLDEFLRGALRGQASTTHLQQAFEASLAKIGAGWAEHVEALASS